MEQAAKNYVRKVLLLHLALLAVVLAGVHVVSREVYDYTRRQALAQAQVRHELIARQTARAIEGHYSAILADLQVLGSARKDDISTEGFKGQWVLAPALWNQMGQRVSHLLRLDPITLELLAAFPLGAASEVKAASILSDSGSRQWLRNVARVGPSVSGYHPDGTGGYTLVAVPVNHDMLLVAVVPFRAVQRLFLDSFDNRGPVAGMLLEDAPTLGSPAAFPDSLAFIDQIPDPTIRSAAERYVRGAERGTAVAKVPAAGFQRTGGGVLTAGRLAPPGTTNRLRERMFTVEPLALPGKRSAVLVSSWVDDVDKLVTATFQRARLGTILVVVVVAGILTSTSVQLIRGRLRLEALRHQMITRELDQARQIQLAWLPSADSGCLPACDIAAANHPASQISGDFYDWFELDRCRVAVTIGDVTGHGMSAAFLMATTQLLVRTTIRRIGDPGRCMEEVNRQLCNFSTNGQFVTMLVAVIDTDRSELEIASAGHFPPMLMESEADGGGARPLPVEPALVLGVEPEAAYATSRVALPAGSGLVFYTDGVIEARASGGEHFTINRLRRALEERQRAAGRDAARAMVDAVVAAVGRFRGRQELNDDLTLVAVQLQANADAAERAEPLEAAV